VTGLNWGSFFDLTPSVKRDICRHLVQERTSRKRKGKGKGKKVTIEEVQDEQEVSAVDTDPDLGDVANFFTKGVVRTEQGKYRISRILVDAGSVVNLMPIHLLRFIGAKVWKAGGMVIRTATHALAKISYCVDVRITIAGVSCDLRVYALPEEYKPTYPGPSYLADAGCRLSRQKGITQVVGIISCISMGPRSEFLAITAHK